MADRGERDRAPSAPPELAFVGLGLYDERSITVAGQDALSRADRAFAEFYTSDLVGTDIETLERTHDVSIEVRDRAGVERDPEAILAAAADAPVCFLTAGDAMVSTTHVDLRLRAAERGIDTRVVHGVSASSAVPALCGLQNYRFGKAVTIPFPDGRDSAPPPSVVESIAANRDRGLHTLCYLDIAVDSGRHGRDVATAAEPDDSAGDYMTADAAADLLAREWPGALGVAVARAGSPDPTVAADRLDALAERSFGGPLHALVLPGDLHHVERDALAAFADAQPH